MAQARGTLTVDGEAWEYAPSGYDTVYTKDQFGVVFQCGTGSARRRRFTRFTPMGSRNPEAALSELSDRQLLELFRQSQPAWTAPESAYGAR